MRVARSRRRRLVPALASLFVVLGACTVFNGLSVPEAPGMDASFDASAEAEAAPVPVDAGPGFLSLDDAVRFCVNAFNCPNLSTSVLESIDVPVDNQHFSSCVDWMAGPLPPDRPGVSVTAGFLKCVASANSCSAAGDCMWIDLLDPGDPRCNGIDSGPLTDSGFDPGSCIDDAGDAIFCKGSPVIYHCRNPYFAPNSSCRTNVDNSKYCDLPGGCGGSTLCDGSVLSYCSVGGLRVSYDCAPGGFTCGTDSTGDTDCLTNGTFRGCTTLGVSCSNNNVAVCDGLYQASYNCVSAGATCDDTFTARCKRPTDTCSPASPGIDTCTGNVINLCTGGQPVNYDCSSIGLTCKPASGGQTAHCG